MAYSQIEQEYYSGPCGNVSAILTRFPHAYSTDVVLCALCPPRRWSDAGVGIGMLRGKGTT